MKRLVVVTCLLATCAVVLAQSSKSEGNLLGIRRIVVAGIEIVSPDIKIESSRGYVIGREHQHFDGIYVTKPESPPAGVAFKKKLIKWADLRKIEWATGDLNAQEVKCIVTYRLDRADAKKEFFVWVPEEGGRYSPLTPQRMIVSGKMRIDKEFEDSEMKGGFGAIEFYNSERSSPQEIAVAKGTWTLEELELTYTDQIDGHLEEITAKDGARLLVVTTVISTKEIDDAISEKDITVSFKTKDGKKRVTVQPVAFGLVDDKDTTYITLGPIVTGAVSKENPDAGAFTVRREKEGGPATLKLNKSPSKIALVFPVSGNATAPFELAFGKQKFVIKDDVKK